MRTSEFCGAPPFLNLLHHKSFPAALILTGFVTQWLPWSRITRVIFLYHMFGGLPFMILALAFILARVSGLGTFGRWAFLEIDGSNLHKTKQEIRKLLASGAA